VLFNEIGKFANVQVEYISGRVPTAYLFDDSGNQVAEIVLGDSDLLQVLQLIAEKGLKLERIVVKTAPLQKDPSDEVQFKQAYYELFHQQVHYSEAKAFAAKRLHNGLPGRLVTINCSFQEVFVKSFLNKNHLNAAWLGAEDSVKEGQWIWTAGPLEGKVIPLEKKLLNSSGYGYSNWASGEPNNANEGENCATIIARSSGWNDVSCDSELASVLVEFGNSMTECPKGPQPDPNVHELFEELDL